MIRAKIISFTARGAQTGSRIAQALYPAHAEQYARGTDQSIKKTNLSRMVQQAMVDCDLIVFVGACGIIVLYKSLLVRRMLRRLRAKYG